MARITAKIFIKAVCEHSDYDIAKVIDRDLLQEDDEQRDDWVWLEAAFPIEKVLQAMIDAGWTPPAPTPLAMPDEKT